MYYATHTHNNHAHTLDDVVLQVRQLVGHPSRPLGRGADPGMDDAVDRVRYRFVPAKEERRKHVKSRT